MIGSIYKMIQILFINDKIINYICACTSLNNNDNVLGRNCKLLVLFIFYYFSIHKIPLWFYHVHM